MNAIDPALHDLLVQQLLGEPLSPADRAQLDAALSSDAALRAEAAELEQTLAQLAASVQSTPPPGLRARVLASVPAPEPARAPTVAAADAAAARPMAARAGRARWPYALAASVTVLAIATGSFFAAENRQLRQDMAQQAAAARMLLEPNVVMSFAMRGVGPAERAAGVVLLDLDAKRASISVRELPTLPDGQSYFLWAELEGAKVPCGQFRTLADGTLLTQFPIPVDSYVSPILRLVMTVETGAAPGTPVGPEVMASS